MSDRQEAFLQQSGGTVVDRFGVWLSSWQIRRHVPTFAGKRVGDFGCGYQASFSRTILARSVGRGLAVQASIKSR